MIYELSACGRLGIITYELCLRLSVVGVLSVWMLLYTLYYIGVVAESDIVMLGFIPQAILHRPQADNS